MMAVTIDLGDETNIHPTDKKPIGDRLLRLAIKDVYKTGNEVERLGFPAVCKIEHLENRLVINFDNCGSGFLPIEGELNGFEIGDTEGNFETVIAKQTGQESITLLCKTSNPSTVRYLWGDYPKNKVKLFNEDGLPVGPFCISVTKPPLDSSSSANRPLAPPIVAHRGASAAAPENTIPAFELAWERGADAIEIDCHLTADGYIVCIHDKDTKKVADKKLVIKTSKLDELRNLDVGSWLDEKFSGTTIPTLTEAMATVPSDKKIYIEVKCNAGIVPKLFQDIKQSQLNKDQIVIISFDAEVIRQVELTDPLLKTYWLTSIKKDKFGDASPSLEKILKTLTHTGTDGVSTNHAQLCPNLIRGIQQAGYQHHVWTVDQPQIAEKLWLWGTESITTNRPEKIRLHFQKETSTPAEQR
jgi:glycerophosphoryl diester phosphodiesterase